MISPPRETAGVLHIPQGAIAAPEADYTGDEFSDQILLAMTHPIDAILPRICYCPGNDTSHDVPES